MRVYKKEFKEEAVKLAIEIGTKKAAEQLGIPEGTLSGWRFSKHEYKENAFPGSGKKLIVPDRQNEVEMAKRIKELERANEILKEALGFFAKGRKR